MLQRMITPTTKTAQLFRNTLFGLGLTLSFTASNLAIASDPLPQRISFQHPLANKDIVMGEVASIFQDSQGYMWFGGANAILRYDGYTFKSILQTVEGKDGIEQRPVKMAVDIFEDSDKVLWISTRTGVLRYDPRTEVLTPVADNPNSKIPITTTDVLQTEQVPSGDLLVASKSGLMILNRETQSYQELLPDPADPNSIHSKVVQTVHIDKRRNIWVGTEAGLEKMDWDKKTFELIKPYPEHPEEVPANSVTDIISDGNGALWLATFNGLVHYDPVTRQSKRYVNDPADKFSLGGNDIWTLWLDSTGALWIASDGGGITVFEKSAKYPEGRFVSHKHEPGRSGSINSNQVRTVFEDNTGDVWVGNYPEGINFFDRSSAAITTFTADPSNPNSLSHKSMLSIREDNNGHLWFGSDGGGLNRYDPETEQFTHYKSDPNNPKTIGSNAVLTVHIDSEQHIWVGTWGGGMSRLNPATGEAERIPFDELRKITEPVSTSKRLNNAHVWSIKEDSRGDMWVATHSGGISHFDRDTKTFTHFVSIDGVGNSFIGGNAWDTFEDSKGNFWVGTSAGLALMDRDNKTFKYFKSDAEDPSSLSNPSVLSMFEDSKGRLWFGTDSGLNLLNDDMATFTSYNKEQGLNDGTIRQILEDSEGKLWLSTNNGVSVFEPDTLKVKNYNRDSGKLMGGFHTDSGIITRKGEIIFGGIEGVRFFNPDKLKENKVIPPIVFTDLKIFADSVAIGGEEGILEQSLAYTDSITLDYKKSMFTFEFSALNFRDPGKNRYAYKLDGFDENWLEVGDQRSAKYTNLNAGTYTFHVRGSNNDGVWNEAGATIKIVQMPPPWKTWWAYTLYGLAVLSVILWFVAHQRKKRRIIEEQNRILEAKVAERTGELKQKNDDIQAMLENMPQGLFTVTEGETIHPEYSHYLEEIFETKEIAGRRVGELLFTGANIGSDKLDAANTAIFAIVGEDEMSYEFNKSLLIDEYDIKIGKHTKYLALDWNPIITDGVVAKLMVSVRDVTRLKEMESEALGQKRELDIISQLLNVSSEKVLGFEESSSRYIASNYDAIESANGRDDETIALLFRNMHTIKGNCCTYGFSHLSDVVHEVESTYSSLKADPNTPWDPDKLLDDLERVKKAIGEYSDIYRRVLGRGDNTGDRHDGFWMTNAVMDKIRGYADQGDLPSLQGYLGRVQSSCIEEVLVDVVSSLSSIAGQLGKPTPSVKFNTHNVRIKNTASELLTDVFAHILRNCVDHGIEDSETRVNAGKDERGHIIVNALPVQDVLNIFVNDDGKGLDIGRLFKKGVELGRWGKDDSPSNQEVAELIFCSGVSTKDAVTDISGRGVGMDAVKKFLAEQGGDVQLVLQNAKDSTKGFVPFELLVTLPAELFFVTPKEEEEKAA